MLLDTDEKVASTATVPWHPLVPPVALVEDPHCEHDAQKWHRLLLNRDGLPSRELLALRITLTQPSPCWRTTRLDELRCYKRGAQTSFKTPALNGKRRSGALPAQVVPLRMRPGATQPWHSNDDAQAVIGLLGSTERLRSSL